MDAGHRATESLNASPPLPVRPRRRVRLLVPSGDRSPAAGATPPAQSGRTRAARPERARRDAPARSPPVVAACRRPPARHARSCGAAIIPRPGAVQDRAGSEVRMAPSDGTATAQIPSFLPNEGARFSGSDQGLLCLGLNRPIAVVIRLNRGLQFSPCGDEVAFGLRDPFSRQRVHTATCPSPRSHARMGRLAVGDV